MKYKSYQICCQTEDSIHLILSQKQCKKVCLNIRVLSILTALVYNMSQYLMATTKTLKLEVQLKKKNEIVYEENHGENNLF